MKRRLILLIVAVLPLIAGCGASEKAGEGEKAIIVMNESDLPKYAGILIKIKGEVYNTKIPQIIGVDIESEDPDLRGKKAMATGMLEKWVVEEKDVDPYSANRGAGTFYRLKDPVTGSTVQVQAAN